MGASRSGNKLTKGTVRGLVIALVIATLLFIVGPTPVQAVTPSVTSTTTSYCVGSNIVFTVTVDIESRQQIPIDNIKVCVTQNNTAKTWVTFDAAGNWVAESADATSWTTSLYSSTAPYGYCYGYGYGYGWQSEPFCGSAYGYIPCTGYGYTGNMPSQSFGYIQGYGYGYTGYWDGYSYTYYPGTVSLQYTVTLNSTGMAAGSYNTTVDVDTGVDDVHYLSSPAYSFELVACAVPGGGAGAPVAVVTGGCYFTLAAYLDAQGRTTVDIIIECPECNVTILIPAGTQLLDAEGNPLSHIDVRLLSTPPPPPGYSLVGPAFDCLPDGATFGPYVIMTVAYYEAEIPEGVSEEDLVVAYHDGTEWVFLTSTVNTTNNTIELNVTHFTPFTILAKLPPAPPEEAPPAPPEEAPPAPPEEAPPVEVPPEEAPPGVNWTLIWVIIAAVVVIIIGVVVWQRRRAG